MRAFLYVSSALAAVVAAALAVAQGSSPATWFGFLATILQIGQQTVLLLADQENHSR